MVLGAIKQIPRQADTHCKVMNEIIWTSSVKKCLKLKFFSVKTAHLEEQVIVNSDWGKDLISFYT